MAVIAAADAVTPLPDVEPGVQATVMTVPLAIAVVAVSVSWPVPPGARHADFRAVERRRSRRQGAAHVRGVEPAGDPRGGYDDVVVASVRRRQVEADHRGSRTRRQRPGRLLRRGERTGRADPRRAGRALRSGGPLRSCGPLRSRRARRSDRAGRSGCSARSGRAGRSVLPFGPGRTPRPGRARRPGRADGAGRQREFCPARLGPRDRPLPRLAVSGDAHDVRQIVDAPLDGVVSARSLRERHRRRSPCRPR